MILRRALLSTVLIACGGSDATNAPPASPSTVTTPDPLASSAANDPTVPKPKAHPSSDKVTWKEDSPPKQCHSTRAAGDLATAMAAMVSGCIDVKAMHRVGQSHAGEGREGDHKSDPMVTRIPLEAKANHCYRVFGLAEPAVKDFDIAVTDSAGKSAGEDLTDSNDAIVLEAGSICFKQDDAASVNAAVTKGGGKWIVEIWSD